MLDNKIVFVPRNRSSFNRTLVLARRTLYETAVKGKIKKMKLRKRSSDCKDRRYRSRPEYFTLVNKRYSIVVTPSLKPTREAS